LKFFGVPAPASNCAGRAALTILHRTIRSLPQIGSRSSRQRNCTA